MQMCIKYTVAKRWIGEGYFMYQQFQGKLTFVQSLMSGTELAVGLKETVGERRERDRETNNERRN